MIQNKTIHITVTLSHQDNITKATKEEILAADYIPSVKKAEKYLKISGYNHLVKAGRIDFGREELTAEELFFKLKKGHTVTSLFKRKDPFNWYGSFAGQWEGSQVVFIDADDTIVPIYTIENKLKHKPTFIFSTQSHQMEGKKNRYRLVYVFDRVMHNRIGYDAIAQELVDEIETCIAEAGDKDFTLDRCTFNSAGFFYGNPKSNIEYITSWYIYSPEEIFKGYDDTPATDEEIEATKQKAIEKKGRKLKKESNIPTTKPRKEYFKQSELGPKLVKCCQFGNYSIDELLEMFRGKYKILLSTPLDEMPVDQPYIPYKEGYQKVWFRPKWVKDITGKKTLAINPFKNGEKRHIMLLNQLIIVRKIHDDKICFDELLFHALHLFQMGYANINKDGSECKPVDAITPTEILHITKEAWDANLAYHAQLLKRNEEKSKFTYKLNPAYCDAKGLRPIQLSGSVRHCYVTDKWDEKLNLIFKEILEGKSVRKLAQILSERTGEKICEKTLARHKKEWMETHFGSKNLDFSDFEGTAHAFDTYKPTISHSTTTLSPTTPTTPYSPNTLSYLPTILSSCPTFALTNTTLLKGSKGQRQQLFFELVDLNKTAKENLTIMADKGLDISLRTYRNYMQFWGLTTS